MLLALEQKMGQLQINSERYTETVRAVSSVTLAVAHGKSRVRTKLSTSKLYGEVSLSLRRARSWAAAASPSR